MPTFVLGRNVHVAGTIKKQENGLAKDLMLHSICIFIRALLVEAPRAHCYPRSSC